MTRRPWSVSAPARLRAAALAAALLSGCHRPAAPPPAPPMPAAAPVASAPPPARAAIPLVDTTPARAVGGSDVTPVLSAAAELATFRLPDGYRLELVAAEPLVQDPIAVDFDADGRMYVVEMRGYMPNLAGTGEDRPIGRIVVLEDTNDDGVMDRKTVFLDSLVLPRAIGVLEHGVLVGETPNLWFARDTNADLHADTKELVRSDYGTLKSNPEHNANGLRWGLDNWIHTANYEGEFHLGRDGRFAFRKTPSLGQWGVSSDDVGRLYRNSNEDPLRADVVASHYAGRDANLPTLRGVYDQLTRNVPVWPGHKTPAVNRGYREETLRPADSTLAHYTSAGSPTVYVGDRLPAELRGSVLVTEPAGNLVGRFDVREQPDGMLAARDPYDHAELITSSDQRFRPVNLANAPDGTMYVVDMYRGIIQHRAYITDYLEQKIKERGMEQPVGLGRVWRVMHTSTRRGPAPRLAHATPAQLVATLTHPNGWWRTTAQRLLVERGDRAPVPALRDLARSAPNDITRLHALWTLDGLGEADSATVRTALRDASPWVRAAAVRVSERWLAHGDPTALAAVLRLAADSTPPVRRQLAASLGELPAAPVAGPSARDDALLAVSVRQGADPVVADLVVSALRGREMAFLDRLLAARAPNAAPTAQALAGGIMRARDPASVERLLARAGEPARPRWQRLALLTGANLRRPAGAGFAGGPPEGGPPGGGGGGRRGGGGPVIALTARPQGLLALTTSADTLVRAQAQSVADALSWPGKARPTGPTVAPLTSAERERFAAGQALYAGNCAGCHQVGGTGLAGVAKPLVGSRWALAPPAQVVRIVIHGKEGDMLMPPVGRALTDDQLAAILTYVRRSWGNTALPIDAAQVHEVRAATASRTKAWTEAELARITR